MFYSLDVPEAFNISELFHRWNADTRDPPCLFLDQVDEATTHKVCHKLFNRGEWNYQCSPGVEELGPLDEGRRNIMFLEAMWQQMGSLAVMSNNTWIELFTVETCGIVPKPDTALRHEISNSLQAGGIQVHRTGGAIFQKAQNLYRAFGRLMIHSLAMKQVLPWNLLPGIYRACK